VSISLAFFGSFYSFYFLVCLYFNKKAKRVEQRNRRFIINYPTVSIIIPVYNEAGVILRRLKNLQNLHYPKDKLETIFVDGGSDDGTADLIEDFSKTSDFSIKVIRQGHRKGFNNAIIEGFNKSSGEIICITGAETEYDPEALNIMIKHFADPKIGAVTGKQMIKNIEEGLSPKLEAAYRNLYDFVREAESHLDSPFDIKGEICATRRSICAHLVEKPELSYKGCIDACISFQAKKDGYQTVYDPNVIYYELSPTSIKDSFKQRIRRGATLIQNMMTFKDMILKRKYGIFGMFIMPAHFLMLTVLPLFFLVGAIGIVAMVVIDPLNYYIVALFSIAILITLLSPQLQAFLKTQIALVIAILGLIIGIETQKFERLSSTRPKN
jgi:cellulose synthase/poly-beta-1,6-N-acetylglucosamine synthase-like glycosyltransferase